MFLVTGATGFIGGHLVELLRARGHAVRCLVRRSSDVRHLSVELAPGDLITGEGVAAALEGVACVIHLAGVTKALRTRDYYDGNTRATEQLVRALAGSSARLVHVSSLAAVGPCPGATPLDEDAPPAPITHYGKSKLEAERIARSLPGAVIVRPPVVYGPRDTDVFQMLKSVSRGIVAEIEGGERRFSAIYVADLALGLLAAAEAPAASGRTYFLTHPDPLLWSDLSSTAAAIMGKRPKHVTVPYGVARGMGLAAEVWSRLTRKPGILSREKVDEARCLNWTCSGERARRELGFVAATSLKDGLTESLAWYKEAGWLKY
jgi:dihydroflavonol-4-reductase